MSETTEKDTEKYIVIAFLILSRFNLDGCDQDYSQIAMS